MRIFLATNTDTLYGKGLTKVGAKDRLVSFFYTKDVSFDKFKEYVENGYREKTKEKKDDCK